MVSNINPAASGATALGLDQRVQRAPLTPQREGAASALNDSVSLSDAAAWRAARESVRDGIGQLRLALSIGQDAQAVIARVLELSQSGAAGAAEEAAGMLASLAERIEAAADSTRLVSGEEIAVQAEPGAAPLAVSGADFRLKDDPGAGDAIKLTQAAPLDAEAARASLDTLQAALSRLGASLRALEAHQGFLGAVEGAGAGVRGDLDADAARLMALQVRQGLDAAGGAAIANVEPQAVLSLFR